MWYSYTKWLNIEGLVEIIPLRGFLYSVYVYTYIIIIIINIKLFVFQYQEWSG
jgi:hypothetical protein